MVGSLFSAFWNKCYEIENFAGFAGAEPASLAGTGDISGTGEFRLGLWGTTEISLSKIVAESAVRWVFRQHFIYVKTTTTTTHTAKDIINN